ncbi:MAG: hypothetical protein EZS28_007779 [Streblomastix strix]|uniref:Uncharacterized protein n=1 Tax=Streblomastix strix TaxID=222440 RepID=A0A5J4WPS3_9EUKA|nr:MAG: hypothetical protein EZS28_007779 [Streblomastix strix]
MIVDWNYVKMLIEKVAKVNENEEECNCVIDSALSNIISLFHQQHYKVKQERKLQLKLGKSVREQFEQEGGNEEIDSNQFVQSIDGIEDEEENNKPKLAMKQINNVKKDQTNKNDQELLEEREQLNQRMIEEDEELTEDDSTDHQDEDV